MTDGIESIIDGMSDDEAEQLGRWWAMRQTALDIGRLAERELAQYNALKPNNRMFIGRDEWERLTKHA